MQAGLLNSPIEIHQKQLTKSEYGSVASQYVLKVSTKAQVINNGGSRSEENNQIFYDYRKTFIVRFYVDVKDDDHILYEGVWYRILNIDVNRKFNQKSIQCERVQE